MWHRIGKDGSKYWGKRGAGIAYTDGNSILLLRRSGKGDNNGKWGLPGGKAEDEETFLGTAQRETREEIGKLPKSRRLGVVTSQDGRHVFQTYVCLVDSKFSCKLSDEHNDWGWFQLNQLPTLHKKLKSSINDIKDVIDRTSPGEHMSNFAEFVSISELAGATADLYAGYTKGGADYQVEGDPSSMIKPRKKKKRRRLKEQSDDELPQDMSRYTPQMAYSGIVDDYFDWYSEVQGEQNLIQLFQLEKSKTPQFRYDQIEFPSGIHVYISGVNSTDKVYPYNNQDNTYSQEEPHDWLRNIEWSESSHEFYGYFSDEQFNKEFWKSPPPLFHGTDDLKSVLATGIEARDQTRGISNRSTGAAVFASTEPESASSYSYGNEGGIVIIDTTAMKRDGFMPFVKMESPLQDSEQLSGIAHAIGVDYTGDESYNSEGINPDTVVMQDDIPAKYVKEYTD